MPLILWTLALSAATPSGQAVQSLTADGALELARSAERRGDSAYAAYYYRFYLRRTRSLGDRLLVAEKVGEILFAEFSAGRGLLEVEALDAMEGKIDGKTASAFPIVQFLAAGEHDLALSFEAKSHHRKFSIARGRVTLLEIDPKRLPEATAQPIALRSVSPPAPATPSSETGWVVIAHPSTAAGVSRERLRELFSGERVVSEQGTIPQVILPPTGSRVRSSFFSEFLGKTEAGFRSSWVRLVFRGGGVKPPIEASSEREVIELVARRPGAFGVVGAENDTSKVTRVILR